MERKFDTNFILNDIYDNVDGVVRVRRFDSNYIWNAIYDPTLPGIRVKDILGLVASSVAIDASAFDGLLNDTITDVQKLADFLDNLTFPKGVWEKGIGDLSVQTVGTGCYATGDYAVAFGADTTASGFKSLAAGTDTIASGAYSHAEGNGNIASGSKSHAEGGSTTASGDGSHTEGDNTQAIGDLSHTEGINTIANDYCEHVSGQFNAIGTGTADAWVDTDNLFTLGNGADSNNRSNAFQVKKNGNTTAAGKMTATEYYGDGRNLEGVATTIISATLTSSGWSASSQTISVSGVTATNEIFWDASTLADNILAGQANVFCSAQATDSLTFQCATTPASDINIKVTIR